MISAAWRWTCSSSSCSPTDYRSRTGTAGIPRSTIKKVVAPLIGLGLPRTGSTALACLLGADPAARSIRNWESMWPCPPPDAATIDSDPRLIKAQASMERRARLFPRMTAMLPSTATSPTECQLFMGHDFKSQIFQAFVHVPTYVEWLNHRADLVPTYEYVKRVLKLLQWRCPPTRWRLKNPSHSLFIVALNEVFPDARFVMTHRDVASVIPSVADLYYELHKAYADEIDLPAIGRDTRDFCALGMQRMIAFRAAGNERSFFRHSFRALPGGPVPHPRGALRFFGRAADARGAGADGGLAAQYAARRRLPADRYGMPSASIPRACTSSSHSIPTGSTSRSQRS